MISPGLLVSILVIALLYAAVGHGGATGYLAVMSMAGVKPHVMATTALLLNCLTAGISFVSYYRKKFFSFKLIFPFLVTSIPAAYLGSSLNLSESQFAWILAFVLIASSLKLWSSVPNENEDANFFERPSNPVALIVGLLLGFLSGAIGIGGGVFLSPLIMLMGWASPKTTAGCAALFIVLNSATGLAARCVNGTLIIEDIFPFVLSALVGALLGSSYGSKYSSSKALRRLVSVVLILAAIKMIIPR